LPAQRYQAAERQAAAAQRGGGFHSLGPWEALGPSETGGRVKAIVIDPTNANTIYAGAATGGVWKSTDAGQSWSPLADFLPALAVNSLAMDPSNPNTLYAGTGEQIPGAGIFKTTDGGQTWTQLAATASAAYVYSLAIGPSRPSQIYAGMDTGLWASMDGGETWSNTLAQAGGCFSVAVRGDLPADTVFAACSSQAGHPGAFSFAMETQTYFGIASYAVYRSADSGGHWDQALSAADMGPTVVAIAPSAPDTVYALAVDKNPSSPFAYALLGLFASGQGGAAGTWQQRANTSSADGITANILSYPAYNGSCGYASGHTGQGAWNLGLAVDPTNPQVLFTAGPRLSRSEDGGSTFAGLDTASNVLFHTDFHAFAFDPNYDGANNQVLYATNDGGVYRGDSARTENSYTNCGQPFYLLTGSAVNNGLQVGQFYHGAVAPGGEMFLGGTQDTVTLLASAGQSAWTPIANGDGGMVAFDSADPKTFYFEDTAGGIPLSFMKTSDGGNSKVQATTGITEPSSDFTFLAYFTLDPSDPQTLYLGGHELWYSADGAAHWQQASADTGAEITAISVNPSNSGQVIFGNIEGTIYNGSGRLGPGLSSAQPRGGYVSRIAFDPNQPAVVYATYAAFRLGPNDSQIYASADGGNTWIPIGSASLPDIPVHVLIVDPENSATLYVGTDIGVFVSFDSGNTWTRDSGFPNVIVESLVPDRGATLTYLYAFTYGRGAFRVNLTRPAITHGPRLR
jgi:hypothetical protein